MSAWHRSLDEMIAEARAKAKLGVVVTEASEAQARRVLAGIAAPSAEQLASSDADIAFRRIGGWSVGLSLQSTAADSAMQAPTWIMSFLPRPYELQSIPPSRMLVHVGAPADLEPWLKTARGTTYYRWPERL